MKSNFQPSPGKLRAVLALCLALTGPAYSSDFSNVVVFGDSLSDAGTYVLVVPPGGGLFTTNPGPVWSQIVSAALGKRPGPAQLFTGTGFVANPDGNIWAQGGARVNASPGFNLPMAQPVSTQIDSYLARSGRVDSNALYALWAGANDIFFQGSSGLSAAAIQANVLTAAQDLAAQIARLQAAGAQYIIVINVPDLGKTPGAIAGGPAAASARTGLSQAYNATLDASLDAAGVRALRLDSFRLINEVLSDPSAFGFKVGNTGVACLPPGSSSLTCTAANFATPTAPADFLFADGEHPSTGGHRIIADYVLSTLLAPIAIARVADRLASTADGQWLSTDSRQRRFLDGLQAEGITDFYVTGQVNDVKLEARDDQPQADGKPYALRVGLDRNFGDGWFAGLAISREIDSIDIAGLGSQKGRGYSIGAYGSKRFGSLYVNAAIGFTRIDYDLKRSFALGAARREEEGSTTGNARGLRLETGYDFAQGIFRHGPLLALTYRHVSLDGYAEDSTRSTALRFGDQKFNQLRSSVGYQATWQVFDSLRLAARLTREHEEKDSRRDLAFGLATNSGTMVVPVGSAGARYTQLSLGVDWSLGKTSALAATLNATSSEDGGHQKAVLLTYSHGF